VNKRGDWRDMYFKNGILIGGDVKNNNAVNFIMANGRNSIAAQNNFLMLKADSGLGAHAKGVNQINNAFGYVDVDQSHKTYIRKTNIDVDIDNSFNKNVTKNYSSTRNFSYSKNVDIDIDVTKHSYKKIYR